MGSIVRSITTTIAVVIAVGLFACLVVALTHRSALAQTPQSWSWTALPPTLYSSTPVNDIANTNYCARAYQSRMVDGIPWPVNVCMFSGDSARFGTYYADGGFSTVVSVGLDAKMYPVGGPCYRYDSCLYVPEADMLVTKQHLINGYVRSMVIYKNFSDRISSVLSQDSLTLTYDFDMSNPDFVYKTDSGYAVPIGGVAASDNGKWLAVELRQRGIGLMNLETFEMRRIAAAQLMYGYGYDPSVEMAVSNDGRHVVVMGYNAGLSMYSVEPGCGELMTNDNMLSVGLPSDNCPQAQLFGTSFIDRFYAALHPTFNTDGSELRFYAASYNTTFREVVMRAAGYEGKRVDYLALGDSFSSGEGETSDERYLPGTNVEFEKCHVSNRSYPFLIAQSMGIEAQYMKSVACSGARMGDVEGDDLHYLGQASRLEDIGLTEAQIIITRSDSADRFLPGRILQKTFVERNQPEIITIGIGGNDAGFSDKLKTCLGIDTCSWAATEKGREQTALEMKALFPTLVDTYDALHRASPRSKIYVIGYPHIVGSASCDPLHTILLNDAERAFLREGVTYLNKVIAAAAERSGVQFVDIADSLGNSTLCGGDKPSAMNGITVGDDFPKLENANWFKLIGQESFHPNPSGHQMISRAIVSQIPDLRTYSYCQVRFEQPDTVCPIMNAEPSRPSAYWLVDRQTHGYEALRRIDFMNAKQYAADEVDASLSLPEYSFRPGSQVTVEIHSTPQVLGVFTAGAKGALAEAIALPKDLEPGFHTVHVIGQSYSGEAIDVYEVIEKRSVEVASSVQPTPAPGATREPVVGNVEELPAGEVASVLGASDVADSSNTIAKAAVVREGRSSITSNEGVGSSKIVDQTWFVIGAAGLLFGGLYVVVARLRRR